MKTINYLGFLFVITLAGLCISCENTLEEDYELNKEVQAAEKTMRRGGITNIGKSSSLAYSDGNDTTLRKRPAR